MYIKARTIDSAWGRILSALWDSPSFKSQRGETKEIHNLLVRVTEPAEKMTCEGFLMGQDQLEEYSKQLLDPDKQGFEYTYGERLRAWGDEKIDQIGFVIEKLKKDPNSRRSLAVTWIPPVDEKKEEVPCLILADFKIRGGKLHLTAVFRSNDMFGAWPANAYGLTRLCEFVAKGVGVPVGTLTTLSISAHIYEHDWENVKRRLGVSK